jgi:hypothetical protein
VGIIIRDTGLHPGQKSFSNHGDVLDFPVVEVSKYRPFSINSIKITAFAVIYRALKFQK